MGNGQTLEVRDDLLSGQKRTTKEMRSRDIGQNRGGWRSAHGYPCSLGYLAT